ncbi:MAG: D-glycero-beta-D-manno-heptose-7-phosphate kinase [Gemmatimonadetes bacterium]|nr:D-glycero-beta-D-manno-heptose-7-phosphate kinase [Gemmatimonadota bacterium]
MIETLHPSPERTRELIERFPQATILIVGDVMLDHFVVGRVDRISPEAPVPVVEHSRDEYRAGGAANVAHNVRALGGSAELVGVVGADARAERLKRELDTRRVGSRGLVTDGARPTTTKLRIVTDRNQQVARVDYETDDEVAGGVEASVRENIDRFGSTAGAILISDYLKGTITRTLVEAIVAGARARRIPVLVDPKIPHIDYYRGATLVTPNHHEAEVATHMRVRTDEDAMRAAQVFRERAACEHVLITRGERGMCLLEGARAVHFPSVAQEVADVTGAGDTVIATLALAMAAGASMTEAAALANQAAGLVVAKFGASTVSPEELVAAVERGLPPEPARTPGLLS